MYRHVKYYPGDPILSLVETFKRGERPEKVNLSIGTYFNDEGKMPVLEFVHWAETERAAVPRPSPYPPVEGLGTYRSAVQRLLFGQDNQALAERHVAAIQTLDSSGALKADADFPRRWFPGAKAYISDPTQNNHKGIFEGTGLKVGTHPCYNPETIGVKFEGMTASFKASPEGSVLILYPYYQNPTGIDVSQV